MPIEEVTILGAGSIGNHMAHAARRLNWGVTLCDIDPAALERSRCEIYPCRYQAWDPEIRLSVVGGEAPPGGADLIIIGTPPDAHIPLARQAVALRPKAVLIEKPICTPGLDGMAELAAEARVADVRLFVGYDHAVGAAASKAAELFSGGAIGPALTIDVEFREEWSGVFAAHPWLAGPADSYLGFWKRGGGSTGEHSHALNLWQFFARACGVGMVEQLYAAMAMVEDGRVAYDTISAMTLITSHGLVGRVVQDVVTMPARKWARVQGRNGAVEWICGAKPGVDVVRLIGARGEVEEFRFAKTRADDFICELQHIDNALSAGMESPIDAQWGFETMLAIAAAHRSHLEGRMIKISLARGWTPEALS
jgi:predicted dehydrogenase